MYKASDFIVFSCELMMNHPVEVRKKFYELLDVYRKSKSQFSLIDVWLHVTENIPDFDLQFKQYLNYAK